MFGTLLTTGLSVIISCLGGKATMKRFKNILKGVFDVIATQDHFSIMYSELSNMLEGVCDRSMHAHCMSRFPLVQGNVGLRMSIKILRRTRSVSIGDIGCRN